MLGLAVRETDAALMVGHDAVAASQSEYFRPLVLGHTRLQMIATLDRIEIDEGASVLAQMSIWCERIDAFESHAPTLARAFSELSGPIHDVLEKVRAELGTRPGSKTFFNERDEQALRGPGS